MRYLKFLLPLFLVIFVLAACSPQEVPVPGSGTPVVAEPLPPTGDLPAAVEAARQALADRLGIAVELVSVVNYEQVDWSDGCLGLGGPEEMCLFAITPGYSVTLEAGGQQYAFRTDLRGEAVREDTREPAPAAVEAARQALANRLGITVEQVNVVDFVQVDWPDGCLGLGGPAESCLAAITPGYAVTLEAGGSLYAFRTDLEGNAVREDFLQSSMDAVETVRRLLADQLGVSLDEIVVVSQAPVEWPDACLGLPAPDELCAMMITPGYEITLQVGNDLYVFHTDEAGVNVRQGSSQLPPAEALRDILAQRMGVSLSVVEPVSEEAVEWPNACLGVGLPDVACAEVLTPGFRLVYLIEGEEYVIHTNQDASVFVLAQAPELSAEDAVIVWEERDMGCSTVLVSRTGAAYGPCDGDLIPALFATNTRHQEMAFLINLFESFEAETEAGVVTFRGMGDREASEIEQRAIAEWARQVFIEAREGQNDPSAGQVIEWQREGGIAGFCDTLRVGVGGFAVAESCKSFAPLGVVLLSPEQLQALYEAYESFQPFEWEERDAAVADSMSERLVFNGIGERPAPEQDQQALKDLANDLYNHILLAQ